ncbi:MEDS domain-containing protein [Nitrososphaera viennensis]|uniref:MEDS domain-containing protein n=2 Tax=Nitrososphaera viennensis TaxID=1034015 RepID=A0A060HQ22_9ARCH|nr:MEDS domain-containing protein [Nitrososphaera viennensis]AIC15287.1 hypothetical protein NVIE_010600 [Nitrososphaera viennensis EN76]UVS70620.1 MEDS domain-containing protein [Nitrososphaera viennensis]
MANMRNYPTITVSPKSKPIQSIKKIVAEHLGTENARLRFNRVNDFMDNVVGFDTSFSCRHILLVYEEIESARQIEMRYLKSRLQKGETCMCLAHSDNTEEGHGTESNMMRAEMIDSGIDIDNLEKTGQLAIITVPNSGSLKILDGNPKSVNAMYLELVEKMFGGKKPPFGGFGLVASEHDLRKPEGLAMQLQLERLGKKGFENFVGTWICPYVVDDLYESLDKEWMRELLLCHDAVICVRRDFSAIALNLVPSNSTSFSSGTIRTALYKLEPSLGRATIEAIQQDMENYGMPLDDDHVLYTIADIELAMRRIFGAEGGVLIMERLRRILIS